MAGLGGGGRGLRLDAVRGEEGGCQKGGGDRGVQEGWGDGGERARRGRGVFLQGGRRHH